MLGRIIAIDKSVVTIQLSINIYNFDALVGKNIVIKDTDKIYIGEVTAIGNGIMQSILIGEIIDNNFVYGDISKPSFKAICYNIDDSVLNLMLNNNSNNYIKIGRSFLYPKYEIKLDINSFFSSHFAILGNSGSGKSCGLSRIIQSLYVNNDKVPINSNLFIFDAYGEYQQAFSKLNEINSNINCKVYTTDLNNQNITRLSIPFWLLGVDDLCLLLEVTSKEQISIIEKALKLVVYFKENEDDIIKEKNDILARCLLDILLSGKPSYIRNKFISILTKYNSKSLNLDTKLVKGGWTRTINQCLYIEKTGEFSDVGTVIEYLEGLCLNEFELNLPNGRFIYTIKDFEKALEFALISEGVLNNSTLYELTNILKIRLKSLIKSDYVKYFEYNNYIDTEGYIKSLIMASNNKKAQIINFNINYIDDRFAKTLVKIYSRLLFEYVATLKDRASFPFHIILEEAHRYIQNDTDVSMLGYNIFERITKEGRKYGILLGVISQRPSELSETVMSQCSNFLVFKMFNPKDLDFIKNLISTMDQTIINKIKNLYPGTCIMYGTSVKMPTIVKIYNPDPYPISNSCDINKVWY